MKKRQQASFTIEAAFIVPLVLSVILMVFYLFFYFHDKAILSGAAYETVVVGMERKNYTKEELTNYFQKRVRGKLILFSNIRGKVTIERKEVSIQYVARRGKMRVKQKMIMKKTRPEKYIRDVRKIKGIGGKS